MPYNKNRVSTNIIDNFIPIGGHCHYVVDPADPSLNIKMIARCDVNCICSKCYIHRIKNTMGIHIHCSDIQCASTERGDDFNIYFEPLI